MPCTRGPEFEYLCAREFVPDATDPDGPLRERDSSACCWYSDRESPRFLIRGCAWAGASSHASTVLDRSIEHHSNVSLAVPRGTLTFRIRAGLVDHQPSGNALCARGRSAPTGTRTRDSTGPPGWFSTPRVSRSRSKFQGARARSGPGKSALNEREDRRGGLRRWPRARRWRPDPPTTSP
jgi:hypothetical protein